MFAVSRFSSSKKRALLSLVVFGLSITGITLGTLIVIRKGFNFDPRRKAASDGANYILNTTNNHILIPGKEQAVINVIMATQSQQVTAFDLRMTVPSAQFENVTLTKGPFFDRAAGPYGAVNPTLLYDQTVGDGSYSSSTNTARLAMGVPVDPCYLDAIAPSPIPGVTLVPCQASPAPQFYAAAANTSGQIATLTVKAKPFVTTTTPITIAVANTTQTAAVGSDTDQTNSVETMTFCLAYDFNKDGKTNLGDILPVSTRFNSHPGDGRYDINYDIDDPSGNGNGVINTGDLLQVTTKFNNTCQP